MKHGAALAHIRQLCCLALNPEQIMPALLKSLRELVRADSAAFFWVDSRGDISDMYAERMLPPELMRLYFERHYESASHSFRTRLIERVRRGELVAEVEPDDALQRSEYYNQILMPLEAHRILQGIVRDHGAALGQLSLYRDRRAPAYSAADRDNLETAMRYVAHALALPRQAPDTDPSAFQDGDHHALLLCDRRGVVVQASHQAHALLAQVSDVRLGPQTIAGAADQASRRILEPLVRRLEGSERAGTPEPPKTTVLNAWGRYQLRAYWLGAAASSEGSIGILIQRQEHLLVRLADAMGRISLSPQQRETALLLAQGKTNPEIAEALGVSLNTAHYHVKQLFNKLDAHGRGDAVARILEAGALLG